MTKLLQPGHWKILIPPLETPEIGRDVSPYTLRTLDEQRAKLNATKSLLDPYYKSSAEKFTAFMRAVDVYKDLRGTVEKQFGAQLVSNAWLKHHELYSEYGLINPENNMIFFNAELPGSGISMWNHNAQTMYPGRAMDWRASSLLADSKHAFGDEYGLFALNREKWLMGGENNGDTTDIGVLGSFETAMAKLGGATTYNHDAGISVDDDYNKQESMNAKLHLGCAIAGFMTLRRGGAFVAKQYTFFETLTWNLILIYASLFDKFYICKPLSSRPTNSEIYLVGIGFKGFPPELRHKLVDKLVNFDMSPLIPERAISALWEQVAAIERFCADFTAQQVAMIREVVDFYGAYGGNVGKLRALLSPIYSKCAAEWLKSYPILPIDKSKHLKSNKKN